MNKSIAGIQKVNSARLEVIACPVTWSAKHKWLQNFSYKTELSWRVFAAAGVIEIMIALIF